MKWKHMEHFSLTTNQTEWESDIAESGQGTGFFCNTIVRTLCLFAAGMLILSVALLAFFIRPTEALLVLHYNVYFGVDLLGAWWQAYILPMLGAGFFSGHLLLASSFYGRSERIAAYLLLLSAGLLNFGILIACIGTVFINY